MVKTNNLPRLTPGFLHKDNHLADKNILKGIDYDFKRIIKNLRVTSFGVIRSGCDFRCDPISTHRDIVSFRVGTTTPYMENGFRHNIFIFICDVVYQYRINTHRQTIRVLLQGKIPKKVGVKYEHLNCSRRCDFGSTF